jgi:hypothetical protein
MELFVFPFTAERIIETGFNYRPFKSNSYPHTPKASKIESVIHIPSSSFYIYSKILPA